MAKTEFEEIYSEMFYSKKYELNDIRLLYIDRKGLRILNPLDIESKYEGMLRISRFHFITEEIEYVEIPIHTIRVIIHRKNGIILDRRDSYQGDKSMNLPTIIFTE